MKNIEEKILNFYKNNKHKFIHYNYWIFCHKKTAYLCEIKDNKVNIINITKNTTQYEILNDFFKMTTLNLNLVYQNIILKDKLHYIEDELYLDFDCNDITGEFDLVCSSIGFIKL